MNVYTALENVPVFKNPAITLGTFDGVHLGHRQILKQLQAAAAKTGGESILLTFWPHPRMVLYPDEHNLKLLNTVEEKTLLLREAGLENLVIIPFTKEFSRLSSLDFIREVLADALHVKKLVIGHDHHFGKNREGTFEQLQECAPIFNFEVERVKALTENGISISSSKIRKALVEGDITTANSYLGYTYPLSGKVVTGKQRGRDLGFPTANVEVEEAYKLIPADGIYAVTVHVNDKSYKGMASIGHNPTFGDTGKTLEVNILDFNENIYDEKITLRFVKFLRKEVNFANTDALTEQMRQDEEQTREFFNIYPKPL